MTLADRFVRRTQDPAPLADKGLIMELTQRLKKAGQASGDVQQLGAVYSVTTIVNLLSILCRGSSKVTHVRPFCACTRDQ